MRERKHCRGPAAALAKTLKKKNWGKGAAGAGPSGKAGPAPAILDQEEGPTATYTLVPDAMTQRLDTSHHTQRFPRGSAAVGMGVVGPLAGVAAPVGAMMVGGALRLEASKKAARGEE